MEEQVQKEVFDWLKTAAEKGADFVSTEAPLVAAEIVGWYFWSSVFLAIVFGLFSAAFLIAGGLCIQRAVKKDEPEPWFPTGMMLGVAGLLFFVPVAVNSYFAVKAAVAPRLVIIDSLKGLAR